MLQKKFDTPNVWVEEYTRAFNKLKKILSQAPVLIPPNWTQDFDVYIDASNFAIGSV